jgi:protein Tex
MARLTKNKEIFTKMNEIHILKISKELKIPTGQIRAAASLLDEGGTVPFISRYRKEATGSLDEVAITQIRDRLEQLDELDNRREAILKSLEERDLLSDELKIQIMAAETKAVLEDIYLPFRPKRRTKATVAKEKGLEPLADILFLQNNENPVDPEQEALKFIDEEKGVESFEAALSGARDIIAEKISEDQKARALIRTFFKVKSTISSKVTKGHDEDNSKYKDYFKWEEPVINAPSHRILAMLRGEKEGNLILHVEPPKDVAEKLLSHLFIKNDTPAANQVALAIKDGYKRLLSTSMETETRCDLKEKADFTAINVFAENLRELLLAPPLGYKNILALDPGFRSGCKVVCLDKQGKLLINDTIYPHTGGRKAEEAGTIIKALCEKYKIEAIAIGNGTASRETEKFIHELNLPSSITVVMVNESGASIYSASEIAREEFSDYDLTVRGSVSIGRRLQDPLAELVKIDAKSIGVGQYQHDVDQKELKKSLDDVVMSCVNGVGVNVNTASKELLTYVSGLGPQLAGNIIKYRNENGAFPSRKKLLKVSRLGPKAFEQSAGFLRIPDAKNPLDSSAVHPESYHIVDTMATDMGCSVKDLMSNELLRKRLELSSYVSDTIGLPTLEDIMEEIAKPGRDPRKKFEAFSFDERVEKIEDLEAGMQLPGIVTNVTAFGAFVDIGVHQDGLVHISQLADRFIKNPGDVVKVQQRVKVTVLEIDLLRKRISLSMRSTPDVVKAKTITHINHG